MAESTGKFGPPNYVYRRPNRTLVTLRQFTLEDAADLFALNSDPEVIRYTGDLPFESVEAAEQFLDNYSAYAQTGFGR